jgi:23S rRNA pseudouridine1911/1915/1917 synthase
MNSAVPDVKIFVVAETTARLDCFLRRQYPSVSTNQWRLALKAGDILVDGRPGAKGDTLAVGQKVSIPTSTLSRLTALHPEPETGVKLDIVYQDDDLLALNKPAHCHTHPLSVSETGTLANYLIADFPELAGVGGFGPLQPGLLNRLDFATSGIVLVARNDLTWERVRQQFTQHLIRKEYVALVQGLIAESMVIDKTLTHAAGDRRRMVITPPAPHCRGIYPARTEVLPMFYSSIRDITLVRLVMYSGVMHQLRVHLAAVGHPLAGDPLYDGMESVTVAADISPTDSQIDFYLHCLRLSLPDGREIATPAVEWCTGFN